MSTKKKELFLGAATALVTPFYQGKIDYKALSGLMDFQLDGGINTFIIAGTTGEAPTLSYAELRDIFDFCVKHVGNNGMIIAGCGSNSTDHAKEIAHTAAQCGCHGLLAVTPYYNKPTTDGMCGHYLSLCQVGLPIILYNVPSRTGACLSMDCYRRLAEEPLIVGVKEASGSVSAAADIIAELGDSLDVYSGNDDLTLPIMALGGKGCISVLSNILPFDIQELCRLCLDGCYNEAAELQKKLLPAMRAIFKETNPIPIKYALYKLGFCSIEYRLPMCAPSKQTQTLIDSILAKL